MAKKKNEIFKKLKTNENNILPKIAVITVLLLLIYAVIMLSPVGKVAMPPIGAVVESDIIAKNEFRYLNKKETHKNITRINEENVPIFRWDNSISTRAARIISNLLEQLPLENTDIIEISHTFEKNLIAVSPDELEQLKHIIETEPNFISDFYDMYMAYSNIGILDKNVTDSLNIKNNVRIIFTNATNIGEREYTKKELEKFYISRDKIKSDIDEAFPNQSIQNRNTILTVMIKLLQPNIIYDNEQTDNNLQNKIKSQGNVYNTVKKGQVIIRRGDILTESAADQIDAMNAIAVNQFSPKRFISTLFIILSFFLFAYFFMRICRVNLFSELKNLMFLSVTILMYVIAVHIPVYTGYDTASNYFGLFIPTATFSLVFTFMYDKQTALFASIVLSMIFFVSSGYNDSGFMFVFLSGITSLFGISKITKRSDLLSLGLRISLRNVAIAVFVMLSLNLDSVQLLPFLGGAAFNGILSAILAVGFIAVGELVLNTPTVFRLQELSDMSSPLLKELLSHAGGTYSHSFTVAGIAENAANDIGANGLLAKVGALYHDTGKIDNPEYFVENQSDYNVHDDLKPSISVAILKNHVKLGVERAKAAKMPDKVIEIIAQHHGTSLIRFFYEKAKNAADSDKEEIDENMYRYPGEKPQFIESAIVMLADQVEAATRALDKPNTTNIEKRVNAIVDGNYESGQLDDSGLTLKDISKIKTSFIRILSGMHHSRIKYPDEKKSEDNQESKQEDKKPEEKSAQNSEAGIQNGKNENKSSI